MLRGLDSISIGRILLRLLTLDISSDWRQVLMVSSDALFGIQVHDGVQSLPHGIGIRSRRRWNVSCMLLACTTSPPETALDAA